MRVHPLALVSILALAACASPPLSVPTAAVAAWTPAPPPPVSAPAVESTAAFATEPVAVLPEVALVQETRGKQSSGEHLNHIALALGAVFDNTGTNDEAARLGIEYERVWPRSWGLLGPRWTIGGMLEFETPPVEALLIAVQLAYHPVPPARLVIAPGINHRFDDDDSLLLRLGAAWEFEIEHQFSIAPEVFYDIMEGGERAAVLAVAFGYGF